jgi:hypothetical protein
MYNWSTLHQPWNYGNTSRTARSNEDIGGKGRGCMNVTIIRILVVDDSIEVDGGYVNEDGGGGLGSSRLYIKASQM